MTYGGPLQVRRDLAANWTSYNPTLAAGEPGYETDTKKLKIGDGSTAWASLPYFAGGSEGVSIIAATGTSDAITATFSPAITLADKTLVAVICGAANTTTTPTFAPNSLTAHTITTSGGGVLWAGAIPAAGFVAMLEYNSANTSWELLNPAITNAWTISRVLTGFSSGAGTVSAADSILAAIQKIVGNIAAITLTSLVAAGTAIANTFSGVNTFTAAVIGQPATLTSSSASVAVNLALACNFTLAMTENTTLANPSNAVAGQSGVIAITQNASAVKTLAFAANWVEATNGAAPAISTTLSAVNVLTYYVVNSSLIRFTLTAAGIS